MLILIGVIFLEFFCEKMHNGNTRPPALSAGEAPDKELKINELGPNMHPMSSEVGFGCEIQLQLSRAPPSTLAPAHA